MQYVETKTILVREKYLTQEFSKNKYNEAAIVRSQYEWCSRNAYDDNNLFFQSWQHKQKRLLFSFYRSTPPFILSFLQFSYDQKKLGTVRLYISPIIFRRI